MLSLKGDMESSWKNKRFPSPLNEHSCPSQSDYLMQHIVIDKLFWTGQYPSIPTACEEAEQASCKCTHLPVQSSFCNYTFFFCGSNTLVFWKPITFPFLWHCKGGGSGAAQKPMFTKHCHEWALALHHEKLDSAIFDDSTPSETLCASGSQGWHSCSMLTGPRHCLSANTATSV